MKLFAYFLLAGLLLSFNAFSQSIRKTDLFRVDYSTGPFIAAIIDEKPEGYFGDIISIHNSDTVMQRRVSNSSWGYTEYVDIPIMDFNEFIELDPAVDTVFTLLFDTLDHPINTIKTFYSFWEGKWRILSDLKMKDYDLTKQFRCYKSGRFYFAEIDDSSVARCVLVIDEETFEGDHLNAAVLADKRYLRKSKSLRFQFIAYDMHGVEVYNQEHTIKYLKKGDFMVL